VASSRERSLPGGLSIPELAEYLVDVGATLSAYGNPTHRTEAVIRLIAELEGCACDVFAVPTGLWLSVRGPGEDVPVVRMARVKEWTVNLDRLAAVDRIFNDVIERKLSLKDARQAIDEVEQRPLPFPRVVQWVAHAAAAAAAAVFFRGGLREVLLAGVGGALLVVVFRLLRAREGASLLADFVGGVLAASLAWVATSINPNLSREVLVLSVIILLVPGMVLTTGLAELANRNLVSGAGRLMEAFIIFLSILFGIACVIALETALGPGPLSRVAAVRDSPALWAQVLALLTMATCFAVLFNVPRDYLLPAMISGAIGWIVTGQATRYLPGSLAAFAAALSVSMWANGCARVTSRPAQVFLLPGLVLLVPGSFGFLSLEAFLRGEFLGGAAKGFEMFLVAGAIVTGLLLANVILPARKVL
jgi:uncharacterized membrane protein YjjP (DUF1212 family)